jgi:hypothetical protein
MFSSDLSAGRAAEVLAYCAPWLNVEHVVVYNAPEADEARLRAVSTRSGMPS